MNERVPARRLPAAAAVLRRALIGWGLGHLAIGDRRGWLLLLLQPPTVLLVALLALELLDSTRWILTFPVLAGLIVVWLGQAVHAHQQAIRQGARPGGELQITLSLPLILVLITAYWLLGGNHASPAATLENYVSDWQAGRAESAVDVFRTPPASEQLAAEWREQLAFIRQRISQAADVHGSASGLDPDNPFTSLRFVQLTNGADDRTVVVAIDIVRRQRVETTLFGLIPTATQETVLVERAGLVRLRAVPTELPTWLPAGRPPPSVWLIEHVVLPVGHERSITSGTPLG